MRLLITAVLAFVSAACFAAPPVDIVCSYAPSQSKAVAALSGAAGGAAGAAGALAAATGTTAVAHSSGAMILTGSGGYIAGTLGTAILGPTIVVVGIVAGGAAVSVELFCAPRNHPKAVEAVQSAAIEFARRTGGVFGDAKKSMVPHVSTATLKIKQVAGDVTSYAFRRGQ